MNRVRTLRRRGFTLVEILIVVVILGILAAIVVPQFASAGDDARAGNIATQLSTLQNQIELYRAREGTYPTLADLTAEPTDDPSAGEDDWGIFVDNGYLKAPAVNPAAGSSTVAAASAAGVGWVYDETDGTIEATFFDEATRTMTDTHDGA